MNRARLNNRDSHVDSANNSERNMKTNTKQIPQRKARDQTPKPRRATISLKYE